MYLYQSHTIQEHFFQKPEILERLNLFKKRLEHIIQLSLQPVQRRPSSVRVNSNVKKVGEVRKIVLKQNSFVNSVSKNFKDISKLRSSFFSSNSEKVVIEKQEDDSSDQSIPQETHEQFEIRNLEVKIENSKKSIDQELMMIKENDQLLHHHLFVEQSNETINQTLYTEVLNKQQDQILYINPQDTLTEISQIKPQTDISQMKDQLQTIQSQNENQEILELCKQEEV